MANNNSTQGFEDLVPSNQQQAAPAPAGNNSPIQQAASSGGSNSTQGFDDLIPQNKPAAPVGNIPGNDSYSQRLASINAQGQQIAQGTSSAVQSGMDMLATFDKQMGDLPRGILQKLSGVLPDSFNKSINSQQAQAEAQAQAARQRSPIAAGIGDIVGFTGNAVNAAAGTMAAGAALGAGLAAGAPETAAALSAAAKAHPLIAGAISGGASNAAYMGAQYTPDGQSTIGNMGIGGAVGAVLPPVLSSAAKIGGEIIDRAGKPLVGFLNKTLNPEEAALSDAGHLVMNASGVDSPIQAADILTKKAAAANAVGVPLSLGETMGGSRIATMEGSLGSTPAGQDAAEKFLNQRTTGLWNQVNNTINGLVPEGDMHTVSTMQHNMYNQLQQYTVPPAQMAVLQNNPALADYIDKVSNDTKLPQAIQNLPDNNVIKLDYVNRAMNDDIYKKTSSITKDAGTNLNGGQLEGMNEAKHLLTSTLNDATPDNLYAKTLDLSQRNIQRNQMLGQIENIVNGPRSSIPTMDSVYKNLFGTTEKQTNFINMVNKSGGDSQAASNIVQTLNQTYQSPLNKIISGTRVAAETNFNTSEKSGLIARAVKSLTTNQYSQALLKLTLGGPQAQARVANYLKGLEQPDLGSRIMSLVGALKTLAGEAHETVPVNLAPKAIATGVQGFLGGVSRLNAPGDSSGYLQ